MPYCENCGREISAQATACPQCGHPGPGARAQYAAVPGASEPAYASWGQRFVAIIIDGLILAVPAWILIAIFVTQDDASTGVYGSYTDQWPFAVLGAIYRVAMEGSPRGQTLGKMAMKIRVQDAATGEPIGYARALLRWFVATILWYAFLIPGLVDVLFPLWDPKKQSLHDKAASSVVVRVT